MIIQNDANHVDTPETTVFRVMTAALTAIVSQAQEDFRKMISRVTTAVTTIV